MQPPELNFSRLFPTDTPSRVDIVDAIRAYDTPGHSHVVGLLLQISKLLGHAPITKVDVYPTKQHGWEIRRFDNMEELDKYVERDSIVNVERRNCIGSYQVNGRMYPFALTWMGVRPSDADVRKKLKQHGARFLSEE